MFNNTNIINTNTNTEWYISGGCNFVTKNKYDAIKGSKYWSMAIGKDACELDNTCDILFIGK